MIDEKTVYVGAGREAFCLFSRDERKRDGLVDTQSGQRITDAIDKPFMAGSGGWEDRNGSVVGNSFITVNSSNFLNQVDFADEIAPPRRRLKPDFGTGHLAVPPEAERFQNPHNPIARDVDSQNFGYPSETQAYRLTSVGWGRPGQKRLAEQCAAGCLED